MISSRFALIAACMMHVEGFYSTKSMSFRNKNPGNIEHASGSMQVYPTILVGFEALVADIGANAGKPLAVFIAKYAPPNENNTSFYAQTVSVLTGIPLTEAL